MKIVLIEPALENVRARRPHRPIGARIFRTPPLGLMMVAAATPPGHEVEIVDEHVASVDLSRRADLVGISVNACVAPRAYEMARVFREKKQAVVLGGFHVTLNPDEAAAQADAIVLGEAEPVWPDVVRDIERGRLRPIYDGRGFPDLRLPPPRRDLVRKRGYYLENVIQATRGCPCACAFCGVNQFFGGRFRARPVPEVIADLRSMRGFRFLFTDDNLTADPDYARELFRQLIPLRKKWMGMTNLSIADDDELLRLAARSGCVGLFLGFETLSPENLAEAGKSRNRVERYADIVQKLHRHGMAVEAGVIFGFDGDTPAVFDASLRAFLRLGFDMIQVAPLTPFPGGRLYERFRREGRLITDRPELYNIQDVVFRPAGMTPEELQAGLIRVRRGFYRLPLVLKRVARAARYGGPMCAYMVLVLNLGYWRNHTRNLGYPP
jgi:radical SAM superfamily enzyme YgiQ (UPF0313 family)